MVDIEDVDQLPSGAVPVDQPTSQPIEEVNQLPEGAVPTSEEPIENVDQLPPGAVPADQSQSDAERYAGVGNTIAASIEGIPFASAVLKGLRGGAAALGVPEQALDYIAPSAEEMAGRAAAHPTAAEIGNVGGTIAELASPAAEAVLGAAPETVLGKIAASSAELGSFQGLGTAADDWSKDKPLDAEKIVASAKIGALFGAGGTALTEGFGAALGKIPAALDAVDDWTEKAAQGDGYAAAAARAYQTAGKNANALINQMVDHVSTLYDAAKQAASDMYEKAGAYHLGQALDQVPAQTARDVANTTVSKIEDLLGATTEEAAPEGAEAVLGNAEIPPEGAEELLGEGAEQPVPSIANLSPAAGKIVAQQLADLKNSIANADSALDVHTALREFATDFDKQIKFDKMPTAGQQADQEVLQSVRSAVRDDLSNPQLWGEAAPVYQQLSDNYAEYKATIKQFNKDFTKLRVGPAGKSIRVVDPVKIASFIKTFQDEPSLVAGSTSAPNQVLKAKSFNNFLYSLIRNVSYSENYATFESGINDLSEQVGKHFGAMGGDAAEAIEAAKKTIHGHSKLEQLYLLDHLPTKISAPLYLLMRYKGSLGAQRVGASLAKGMKVARAMAERSDAVTDQVEKGARGIFRASASEESR